MCCVIENTENGVECEWDRALVACSLDCAKVLREIARIQRRNDYVLLASHVRVLPDADRSRDFLRGCAVPEQYLLLSEIAARADLDAQT